LRFADGQDAAVVADLYDRFAFEASMIDRFQDVADARQRALLGTSSSRGRRYFHPSK